jgi:hypothetical protein
MARYERFTFLCDPSERRAIADLTARLQRSQSDAVRFVVIEAAKQLTQADLAHVTALPVDDTKLNKGEMNVTH